MARPTKRRAFSYQENDAAAGRRMSSGGGGFDNPLKGDQKSFKVQDGKNRVRILPRTWSDDEGPRHWGYEVWVHYGIGADNSTYLCLKKMKGERCPICEERERLAAASLEDDAKQIRPVKRVIAYVIDRKNEHEGPMVWWMPATKVAAEIADRSDDAETGRLLKIDHPEEGYDVTFKRSGQGLTTQYTAVDIARTPSAISEDDDELDDWLDQIVDAPLPSLLNYFDADYLEQVFAGSVTKPEPKVEPEQDDEPPPRPRRSRPAAVKSEELDDIDAPTQEVEEAHDDDGDNLRDEVSQGLRRRRRRV
tara:strand:+ start:5102 stop:6019 length:918 start_codon:yes stop_codon:yes gene_type:complete